MRIGTFIFFFLWLSKFGLAQDLFRLSAYLDSNKVSIDMRNVNESNDFLKAAMVGKNLLVFGEGGSHQLDLNDQIRVYLVSQLVKTNLKYFFIEGARSSAYLLNKYLKNDYDNADSLYSTDFSYRMQMKKIRALYQSGFHFEYRGIDMEWSRRLYNAVKMITANYNFTDIQKIPLFHSILVDTAYLHYDPDVFKNQKEFLKYYKVLKKLFTKDSSDIQIILTKEDYREVKYFLTNEQMKPPLGNRNIGMAKNLLDEIKPIDTSATYLLDVGMAHSLPNRGGSVAGIAIKDDQLKNRTVVMNVYCEECTVNEKEIEGTNLNFLRNKEVLNIFRKAATKNLTLFDLSKLPADFNYIKEYGSLLLFAKHQK